MKNPPADGKGGWNCYITDIIKETDYTNKWNSLPPSVHRQKAEIWYEILKWEYGESKPKMVVVMGKEANKLLTHLTEVKDFEIPKLRYIDHYAYIGQHPERKLPPMHPKRIRKYEEQMRKIADEYWKMNEDN